MSGNREIDVEHAAAMLDGALVDLQMAYGVGRYTALKCLHLLTEAVHNHPGDHVTAGAQFFNAITEAADRRQPWAVTVHQAMRKEWGS